MMVRSDSVIAEWIALLLFGVYLLSYSGRLYSQDSMSMFSVTESAVKRGEFNSDQMWTLQKARDEISSDGESYAKYGYGASLFAVPLYAFAYAFPIFGMVQTTLLSSAVVVAITGALLFLAARRVDYSRGVSVAAALLFGLGSPAWVYAKQFWSETFGVFTLFAAFYFLLCFRLERHGRDALFAGIALGLAVATRVTNAALVPFFAWYGFGSAWHDWRARRGFARFALVLALAALSIAAYDWIRFGSPLATGYRADESFDNPVLLGLYGLLFSPGKGLFAYVPFLAVLPFSAPVFFQRAKRETILIGFVFAYHVLLFSAWYYWWGGTNWSPRFLVPTLPFLVLLAAPAIELAINTEFRRRAHIAFSAIFIALCVLSIGFELVGISVPSLAYRARMVRLSANPDWDTIFTPQFSPLIGSLNLLRPSVLDFGWFRLLDNIINVDWLVVALTLTFITFCGTFLVRSIVRSPEMAKHRDSGRDALRSACGNRLIVAGAFCAIALSLFSLFRYRDDFRFGGNDGYRALLQVVAREEQPRDVMVLDNDVFMPFFLNENRARVRWYGLSRDPKQWDGATRMLLARLSRQYARVWLAYDDSNASLPDPTRDWLDQSLREIARRDFGDGVHLALYTAGANY